MGRVIFFLIILLPIFFIYPVSERKNPDKPLKGNWDFDPKMIWEIENAGNNALRNIDQILIDRSLNVIIPDKEIR